MMAEWLREALFALPVLLILPLIWLVWRFFADSMNNPAPVEAPPQSRAHHLQHAAIWSFITVWWGYMLIVNWHDAEPDRFMTVIYALAASGGLFEVVSRLRRARTSAA